MSEKALVKVENLSKKFCRSLKRSLWYGVQDVTAELFKRARSDDELRKNEFWALENISLELERGDCLGLIGPNGAGKSTLLKVLNGLVKPDKGRITMRGRVGALIELGAGFNPILTARENIYVNGSLLGFSKKEIDLKLDSIIDFSEIEKFVDTPVQNFSSGMKVRLGFAVAAQMEPDVLLIDEVLAVGDIDFSFKCINRINEMAEDCAVIVVSHSMPMIARLCTHAMSLKHGLISYSGSSVHKAISEYFHTVNLAVQSYEISRFLRLNELKVNGTPIVDVQKGADIQYAKGLDIALTFDVIQPTPKCFVNLVFMDMESKPVAQCLSKFSDVTIVSGGKSLFVRGQIESLLLNPGRYFLHLALVEHSGKGNLGEIIYQNRFLTSISVSGKFMSFAPVQLLADWNYSS
jgi:lipopolysaccharide transport system ATP-binding protein